MCKVKMSRNLKHKATAAAFGGGVSQMAASKFL